MRFYRRRLRERKWAATARRSLKRLRLKFDTGKRPTLEKPLVECLILHAVPDASAALIQDALDARRNQTEAAKASGTIVSDYSHVDVLENAMDRDDWEKVRKGVAQALGEPPPNNSHTSVFGPHKKYWVSTVVPFKASWTRQALGS